MYDPYSGAHDGCPQALDPDAHRLHESPPSGRPTPELPDEPALLDALFTHSPFSVALYDAEGRVSAGNPAYERHFGIRLADIPRDWSLFGDPQLEAAGVLPLIRRAYAGEHVVLPPVRYDAAQATGTRGRAVWTQGQCYPVRDAGGQVTHVAVVHVDVTAVMESEAALQQLNEELADRNALLQEQAMESEAQAEELQTTTDELLLRTGELAQARDTVEVERARLGRVVAQLPAAVAVVEGPDLVFRGMSAQYRAIVGGRDVIGQPIRTALPELAGEGDTDFFALMEQVYHGGETFTGAGLAARWDADGDGIAEDHFVDVVYAPLRGVQGAVEGVTLLVLDVTDRVRAEHAVRESEARFRSMADAAPVMLWVTEPDGRCTFLNRQWYEYTGQTPATGLGYGWLEAVHPEDRAVAEREFREAASAGRAFHVDYRLRRHDGEYRWAVDAAAPRRGPDGQYLGFIGSVIDIEERTRLLEAERVAHAAAERAGERARRLQRLTARLNEAASLPQVADVILSGGMAAVGAEAGSLALVLVGDQGHPDRFEIIRTEGYDPAISARYRSFPVSPGRPLSDTVRDARMVLIASPDEWRTRYPNAMEDLTELGFGAFVAIPVTMGDRVAAVLSFSFRAPQAFDEATRTFLATLAEQCALAFERARLHEAELRHAEKHAALLATIQDAFVGLDRDLRFTYANARAEELLGRSRAELLGRRLEEALPQAPGSPIIAAIEAALDTGKGAQLEAWSALLGRWIEARLYPAPDGVTLVIQDVTARKRAQDAAGLLAEASRLLSATLDYEATLRAVAEAVVPQLGDWCAVDVVRDPTSATWPPTLDRLAVVHRDADMLALGLELAAKYPTDWSADTGMAPVLRDGTPMFVPQVTAAMVAAGARDPDHLRLLTALQFSAVIVVPLAARGLTLGALTLCMTTSGRTYDETDLALATDLAQRAGIAMDNARLYREAERARAEAESANRAKSQFLATMSHELRTPLNAIQGHVQLLDMELHGPVTDAQRDALGRVERAQQHLLSLIDEVLGYARLESGRVEYDVRPVRVIDVVADVLPMVESQLAARGIAFVTDLAEAAADRPASDEATVVLADREKLAQVLINLLSNAAKFTAAGGRVTVSLDGALARGGDAVQLRVTDTGIGIPADKLEAIFEPFVQVRGPYSPGAGGTGLGLAISRDLARGMGADLHAESVLGEGSSFVVTLRRAR